MTATSGNALRTVAVMPAPTVSMLVAGMLVPARANLHNCVKIADTDTGI
jgi:hypothetical protein